MVCKTCPGLCPPLPKGLRQRRGRERRQPACRERSPSPVTVVHLGTVCLLTMALASLASVVPLGPGTGACAHLIAGNQTGQPLRAWARKCVDLKPGALLSPYWWAVVRLGPWVPGWLCTQSLAPELSAGATSPRSQRPWPRLAVASVEVTAAVRAAGGAKSAVWPGGSPLWDSSPVRALRPGPRPHCCLWDMKAAPQLCVPRSSGTLITWTHSITGPFGQQQGVPTWVSPEVSPPRLRVCRGKAGTAGLLSYQGWDRAERGLGSGQGCSPLPSFGPVWPLCGWRQAWWAAGVWL